MGKRLIILGGGAATRLVSGGGGGGGGSSSGVFINVKDSAFGAVGDGTADDTSAIDTAITFAKSIGGGRIYFPPGTYKVTGSIVFDSLAIGITFYGDGN